MSKCPVANGIVTPCGTVPSIKSQSVSMTRNVGSRGYFTDYSFIYNGADHSVGNINSPAADNCEEERVFFH